MIETLLWFVLNALCAVWMAHSAPDHPERAYASALNSFVAGALFVGIAVKLRRL